jgi:PAS domain S-box-containing protein
MDRAPVPFADIPFRGIVEQSLAGVYVIVDERFRYANDTFAAMFGYRVAEFLGMHLEDLMAPESKQEALESYRQSLAGREGGRVHDFPKCLHRDGHIVHLEVHGSIVEYRGRPALSGVAIDITERVRREEELRESRRQLRQLAAHLSTVREEQRAVLAREVHDVLGGMLTSIKLDVGRIVRRTEAPALAEIRAIATDLVGLVQETIDTARKISDELRPSSLDTLGLTAAIRDDLRRFESRHGVRARLRVAGSDPTLSALRATQCYRIFQEALTNVARHAQASEVEVVLSTAGEALVLTVRDDGCGIDTGAMRPGSLGLLNMRERARRIGGTLELNGGQGRGTSVTLRMPLGDAPEAPDD